MSANAVTRHSAHVDPQAGPLRGWMKGLPFARKHAAICGILLLGAYLITLNVWTPWQSVHEDNGLIFESIAINHIRLGLATTKGQDVLDARSNLLMSPPGVVVAQQFQYYLTGPETPQVYGHHPPFLGLTIAASLLTFGYHFWAIRLIPIMYTLLSLVLFYLLVNKVFDVGVARVASGLFAVFPMTAYYGRNVAHEAPTLFWALLLLIAYLQWRDGVRRRLWGVLMVAAIVIGGFYGWPMFYFAFILFGIDYIARRHINGELALLTIVPAVVTFVAVIVQLAWVLNWDMATLKFILLARTGVNQTYVSITFLGWLNGLRQFNAQCFGAWTQWVAPVTAVFIAMRAGVEGWSRRMQLVAIFGLWGLSHVVIFSQAAFIHAYWQFYFIPFIALTIGWATTALVRHFVPDARARGAVLAFLLLFALMSNLPDILGLYSNNGQFVIQSLFSRL